MSMIKLSFGLSLLFIIASVYATPFYYGGRLVEPTGEPLTGTATLQFDLWVDGSQTDCTSTSTVTLSKGVFNSAVDFDSPSLTCSSGSETFVQRIQAAVAANHNIEIAVTHLDASPTPVAYPRQRIGASPMALFAVGGNAVVGNDSITGAHLNGVDSCAVGQVLTLNASGIFQCTAGGTVTSVSAGNGITITGGASTPTIAVNLDNSTLGFDAGNANRLYILNGGVGSTQIANGAVDANHLTSDAVTTIKILDSNVTTAKLANSAVTSAKLAADAVDSSKIADGSIGLADLADACAAGEVIARNPGDTAWICTLITSSSMTVDANHNIYAGSGSGAALTTGSNNLFLGQSAGAGIDTGVGNVFIGNQAGKNKTAGSNQFLIDNQDRGSSANENLQSLVVGTFDSDVNNQRFAVNAPFRPGSYAADPTGLAAAANEGYMWWDSTANKFKFINGSGVAADLVESFAGDITDVTVAPNQGLAVTNSTGPAPGLSLIDCAANEVLIRNAGDTAWVCASSLATGVQSLNGETGVTQTLAINTAPVSTAGPAWSSSSNTHTLDIPLVNNGTLGTDAGLLLKSDYDSFVAASTLLGGTMTTSKFCRYDGTDIDCNQDIASGVVGSIQFSNGSGVNTADATNLFWDDANNRLGVGTNAPNVAIETTGNVRGVDSQFTRYCDETGSSCKDIEDVNSYKDNTAAADPTVNDDSGDGYSVGSRWTNTASSDAFVLIDESVGAAVWKKITTDGDLTAVNVTANQGLQVTNSGGPAPTLALVDCAANEILIRNAGDTAWVCSSSTSTGVQSLNGETGTTQTLAINTAPVSTTGPAWSSASNAHTLNIPLVNNATLGTDVGLLRKSDFDSFDAVSTLMSGTMTANKFCRYDGTDIDCNQDIASGVVGSIQFSNGSGINTADATNLFWDDGNNRLGVGTNAPNVAIETTGNVRGVDAQFARYCDEAGANCEDIAGIDFYKDNIAVSDPTVNDDSTDGYKVGSRWTNSSTSEVYILVDESSGAAVWKKITYNDTTARLATDGSNNMAANLDMNSNKLVNVANPTNSTDGANKAYVDEINVPQIPASKIRRYVNEQESSAGYTLHADTCGGGEVYVALEDIYDDTDTLITDMGFCIETSARTADSWEDAKAACVSDGKRLPRVFEWHLACERRATLSVSISADKEWVSNFSLATADGNYYGTISMPYSDGCADENYWYLPGGSTNPRNSLKFRCVK